MSWRLAKSLDVLRAEVNARWPERSKASDGTIGDAAHAADKTSDHNPNAAGVVRAFDITTTGIDAPWLAEHFRKMGAAGDVRLLDHGYVIYDRRIASETAGWKWRAYSGSDPHTNHIHLSVSRTESSYDLPAQWGLAAQVPTQEDDVLSPEAQTFIDKNQAKWAYAIIKALADKLDIAKTELDAIKRELDAHAAS